MQLVTSWGDIEANINRLQQYSRSHDGLEVDFFKDRIKRGRCFVVHRDGNNFFFGPSRFLGYKNNELNLHHGNIHKDGRETNREISKVLGHPPKPNALLEKQYLQFCNAFDVVPDNVPHKYWIKT